MAISKTNNLRKRIAEDLNQLIKLIGFIKIGEPSQFPYGWRQAAKGRTVWRILEEAVCQNLEYHAKEVGIDIFDASESEVGVYDFKMRLKGQEDFVYVNIKSSIKNGKKNKDDISKAERLIHFYEEDYDRELFLATFEIDFKDDMSIEFTKCIVTPIHWIPDVYVNPSNKNLQSSKYKDSHLFVLRSQEGFCRLLNYEIELAKEKRLAKHKKNS